MSRYFILTGLGTFWIYKLQSWATSAVSVTALIPLATAAALPCDFFFACVVTANDVLYVRAHRCLLFIAFQIVRSRDGETIYLGTEAVVLRTGLLVTKAEYEATRHHPVVITGRVEFFNTSSSKDTTFVNDAATITGEVWLLSLLNQNINVGHEIFYNVLLAVHFETVLIVVALVVRSDHYVFADFFRIYFFLSLFVILWTTYDVKRVGIRR
jgi:hypothetical protein